MNDEQKALAYYKAAVEQVAPQWVPARVRLARDVFGDPPFRGAGVAAGEHDCNCNQWGAVDVLDRAGQRLGLRPNEFEPVAWRENAVADYNGGLNEAYWAYLEVLPPRDGLDTHALHAGATDD